MKVVVIGGTGLIGSKLVEKLNAHGHDAVPAAPQTGVNTLTGEGLAAALAGADVVVDVSNSPSFADDDVHGASSSPPPRNLLEAEKDGRRQASRGALGRRHRDRLPDSGYLRAKAAQEELIRQSGVPYSIVHATQFFEFTKADRGRVARSTATRCTSRRCPIQPIASDDVASAVATCRRRLHR